MTEPTPTSSHARLPDDSEESHVRMSFGQHLEELRKRVILALLGSAIVIGVCLWYSQEIVNFLTTPYLLALRAGGFTGTFGTSHPGEVVWLYLAIGVKAGLIVAAPWIIYQVWLFVAAGLYQRERRIVYKYIGPSILLFLAGAAFFYFIVLPLTLRFFVDFTRYTAPSLPKVGGGPASWILPAPSNGLTEAERQRLPQGDEAVYPPIPIVKSDPSLPGATAAASATAPASASAPERPTMRVWFNATEGRLKARIGTDTITFLTGQEDSLFTPIPKLDEYLHFVTFTALIFGCSFELPMVMVILAQIGLVHVKTFRRTRRIAYFILVIAAALLSPGTDVVSMISLFLPLLLLYEMGILGSALFAGKPEPEEPETE